MRIQVVLLLMVAGLVLAGCGVGIASPAAVHAPDAELEDLATLSGDLQLEITILDEAHRLSKPLSVEIQVPAVVKDAMQQCAAEQQGMIVLGEGGHYRDGPLRRFIDCTVENLHREWLEQHAVGEII